MDFSGYLILAVFFVVTVGGVRWVTRDIVPYEIEVMERWSAFLPGQSNAKQEFLQLVETELDARSCPYSVTRGAFRQHLATSDIFVQVKFNFAYYCYIGFEKVGKDLLVFWSVREKTSIIYLMPIIGPMLAKLFAPITFVDHNKLLAFAAFTKNCAENAVDSLMDKNDLDKTKLIRASSGKLGPL